MQNVQKHTAFSPSRGPHAMLPGRQRLPRPLWRLPLFGIWGRLAPQSLLKRVSERPQKVGVQKCARSLFGHPKSHKSAPKGGSESNLKKGPQKVSLRTLSGPSKCSRRLSESLSGTFQPGPTKGTKRAPKSDPKRSRNRTKPRSEAAPKTHRETSTEKLPKVTSKAPQKELQIRPKGIQKGGPGSLWGQGAPREAPEAPPRPKKTPKFIKINDMFKKNSVKKNAIVAPSREHQCTENSRQWRLCSHPR